MIEGKVLDIAAFTERKCQSKYPYIELQEINNTLPLVLSILEAGDLQVIAIYKEKRRVVGNISASAYNIVKLLGTQGRVLYHKGAEQVYDIRDVIDYLEVI